MIGRPSTAGLRPLVRAVATPALESTCVVSTGTVGQGNQVRELRSSAREVVDVVSFTGLTKVHVPVALVAPLGPAVSAVTVPVRCFSSSAAGAPRMSPAARHHIVEKGLNPADISGTGKHGIITKGDVLAFVKGGAPARSADTAGQVSASDGAASTASASTAAADAADEASGRFEDIPATPMRKVIASRLTESKALVPHSYYVMESRIDALLALRKTVVAAGVKVSVNDLVIKAASLALRDVPQANARFDTTSNTVVYNDSVDVSVAVATDGGLITPIVEGSDKLGLAAINSKIADLAGRARKGALSTSEYQGGTFTVSNLGMFGIPEFSAVINPPQGCILAVGGGQKRAVFPAEYERGGAPASEDVEPEVATIMAVQLSADRRVVDDATAGEFLATFRHYMENPVLLSI